MGKFPICAMVLIASIVSTLNSKVSYAEGSEPVVEEQSLSELLSQGDGSSPSLINLNYFGILYGPSVGNPTSYQPDYTGGPDRDHPIILKNYLSVSKALSDQVTVAATGSWIWQPVQKQDLQLLDPFVRVGYNSIFHLENFNLYGDLRAYFPISSVSRQMNQKFSMQTFQALTYTFENSRLLLATYIAEKVNFYGAHGFGNDMEFYLAPNVNYQLTPTLALSVLFEMYGSHTFGRRFWAFNNDGSDLEPGIVWDITPRIMLNPYLNLMTGGKVTLNTTSLGVMLSVNLL